MARQKLAIFIILILGVGAFFFFSEKGSLNRYRNNPNKNQTVENQKFEENEIGGKISQDQAEVTEISSHGEEQATLSRAANEVPRKPSRSLPKPDQRSLEASLTLENTRWKIWSGVSAVAKSQGSRPDAIGEVSGFYLVQDDRFRSDERNFSSGSPLVVFDQRRDAVGVVTGSFEVTLNEGVDIRALVSNQDLRIINAFPESHIYFVTSATQPFNLQNLYQALKNDSGVKQVDIEVLSRHYEKH